MQSSKLKKKEKLPKINLSHQPRANTLSDFMVTNQITVRKNTNLKPKIKIVYKTPSSFNSMLERIKRDFSIAEHSPLEQIRVAKRHKSIKRDFDSKNAAQFFTKIKNEKNVFKKEKDEQDSHLRQSTILQTNQNIPIIKKKNIFDTKFNSKKDITTVLDTIEDISSNLIKISKNIHKKQNHFYNKNIKFEYDLLEMQYNPTKVTGIPSFLKTRFNKNTVMAFKALAGINFGGKGIR
jgi:hypothetical protein